MNWGDGSSNSGTVTGSNGLFRVLGTHSYFLSGIFPLSMVVPAGNGPWLPPGGGGGGGSGGGGQITNVQLVGPTAVPGLSQYRYLVTLGAAPPGGVLFTIYVPHPPGRIVDSGVIRDAHGNDLGLYLDVAYSNKAGQVFLEVGVTVKGSPNTIVASTVVTVVQVNVLDNQTSFSSPAGYVSGQKTVQPQHEAGPYWVPDIYPTEQYVK